MLAIGRACICGLVAVGDLRGDIAIIARAESVQCVYITGAGYCVNAHWVVWRLTASIAVRVLVACVLIANRVAQVGIADFGYDIAATGFSG